MEPVNQTVVPDHFPPIEEYKRALPNLVGRFNYLPFKKFQFTLPDDGGTIIIDEPLATEAARTLRDVEIERCEEEGKWEDYMKLESEKWKNPIYSYEEFMKQVLKRVREEREHDWWSRVSRAFKEMKSNVIRILDEAEEAIHQGIRFDDMEANKFMNHLSNGILNQESLGKMAVHLGTVKELPNTRKKLEDVLKEQETVIESGIKRELFKINTLLLPLHHVKEQPHLRRNEGICASSRGIVRVPNSSDSFFLFSADGDFSVVSDRGTTESRRHTKKLRDISPWSSVSVSPSGQIYCISDFLGKSPQFFRSSDDQLTYTQPLDKRPFCVQWLSESQLVIECGGPLLLYDLERREVIREVTHFKDYVYSLCAVDDNKSLLVGDDYDGKRVYKVRVSDLGLIWQQTHHTSDVNTISQLNSQLAVSGSEDNSIILFNIGTGDRVTSFNGFTEYVKGVKASPCEKYILALSGDELVLLRWEENSPQQQLLELGRIDQRDCGKRSLEALEVMWEKQYAVVGDYKGGVYTVELVV
jgi:hypothetical protein